MSKRLHLDPKAEQEANEVASRFMNSSDVVGDMSRAYGRDLSSVRIHTDENAARKVAPTGADAFSTGKDIFFGRGAFDQSDPASRGLLAHELTHSLQQGIGGDGMAQSAPVSQAAPQGAAQGGILDWFRKKFGKKKQQPMQISAPLSVQVDNSPEARSYQAAMARATTLPNQVAGRMNAPTAGSGNFDPALLADIQRLGAEGTEASNRYLARNSNDVAGALVANQLRGGAQSQLANAEKSLRGDIFSHLATDQMDYLKAVGPATDMGRFTAGASTTQLATGSNSYTWGAGMDEMNQDWLNMFAGYATSDDAIQYFQTLKDALGNGDVFTSGQRDIVNFVVQNAMVRTSVPAHLARGVGTGEISSESYQASMKVLKTLQTLPALYNYSEEDKANLPPAIQQLLTQYSNLVEQIRSKLG